MNIVNTTTGEALSQDLILVNQIVVNKIHNPRVNFRKEDHERLVDSIREAGLITPITVRPNPEGAGYELIAGERRLRAVKALGWESIPSLVRYVDDVEARRLALLENIDRKDLTPAEEALVAQRHVDGYEGDHEAAARGLGWNIQKLRHRLRLLHCAPEVMEALVYDKLTLGHAELLATLPQERQIKALPKILSEEVSVAALKEQLQSFSLPLSLAVFDTAKAGCAGCQFNSTAQGQLFEAHIDAGRCTNKECFGARTREALEEKRTALREDYGTVGLLTEKVPDSTVPILVHGERGIGQAGFSACRGCAYFGAVIDDRLGATTGRVDQPLCFNKTCHSEKVEAYRESLLPPPPTDTAEATQTDTRDGAASRGTPVRTKAKNTSASASRAVPGAVGSQYARIVRQALKTHMASHPETILGMAIYGMARLVADETGRSGIESVLKGLGMSLPKDGHTSLLAGLMQGQKADLQLTLIKTCAALLDTNADETSGMDRRLNRRHLGAQLVMDLGLDLAPFVTVDEPFLTAHTKAGISQLLDESGFSQWMRSQQDGEKAHKELLGSGKADLIKGILAANYPGFAGYVPGNLVKMVREWRAQK